MEFENCRAENDYAVLTRKTYTKRKNDIFDCTTRFTLKCVLHMRAEYFSPFSSYWNVQCICSGSSTRVPFLQRYRCECIVWCALWMYAKISMDRSRLLCVCDVGNAETTNEHGPNTLFDKFRKWFSTSICALVACIRIQRY